MSEAEEYLLYADETIRWINDCTDPQERVVLLSLARTWLKAASRSDSPGSLKDCRQNTRPRKLAPDLWRHLG
jgi:hypothetical protein